MFSYEITESEVILYATETARYW